MPGPWDQYAPKSGHPALLYRAPAKPTPAPSGYAPAGSATPLAFQPGGPNDPAQAARMAAAEAQARVNVTNPADIAKARALSQIALQQKRQEMAMAAGDDQPVTVDPNAPTGAAYLKKLPTATAATVKALLDGRMAFPAGAGMRSPYWQHMLAHVAQTDPNFDAVNYNSRNSTRREFTAGQSAKNIKALNTAIGHLGQLDSQIGGTASHGGFPFATTVNSLANRFERGSGDPGITNYEQTSGALASELTQVFRGSGGAEADVKRYLSELDPNASEAQKKASIKNIAGLLQSRLNAIGDQYKKGMGTTADPLVLLDDHAQHVMGNLGFGGNGGATPPNAGPGGNGGTPPALDQNPAFNGPSSAGPQSLATGPSRTENDPQSSALIDRMVRAGATADQINASLPKGLVPVTQEAVAASQTYLKNNPHYQGSFGKVTHEVGNSLLTRMSASPLATVATQAANAGTAGYLDEFTGGINSLAKGTPYAQERDAADIAKQAQAAGNPGSAIAGNVIGGGAAMLGAGALGMGGVAGRYLGEAAPLVGDAAYGALYGSGESNGNRLTGALAGGIGGAVGSRLGSTVTGMFGRGMRGVQNEAVRYLDHAGVPMTGGQMLGGVAKSVEDKLTSIPFVGEAIKNRRAEGYNAFNQAAFNQAGAPIGANVGAIGDNGLNALDHATGQAYTRALGGVNVNGNDPAFIGDMSALVGQARNLPEPMAGNADYTLRTRIGQGFDNAGNMTGNDFQQSVRGLRRDARAVAPLPYGHDFGQVAQGGENALEGLLTRQAPGVLPRYRAANSAFRHQSTLDSVVNGAAKNQIDDAGNVVFTPAQLNAASVRNGGLFGGQRPFQQLAQSGQQVLPSKIPDSGTAGRAALGVLASGIGGSAAGAATGYGVGDPSTGGDIGGGLGIAAAMLNSRAGQRALTAALLRRPQIAEATGNFLVDNARYGGHLFGPGGGYLLSGTGQ